MTQEQTAHPLAICNCSASLKSDERSLLEQALVRAYALQHGCDPDEMALYSLEMLSYSLATSESFSPYWRSQFVDNMSLSDLAWIGQTIIVGRHDDPVYAAALTVELYRRSSGGLRFLLVCSRRRWMVDAQPAFALELVPLQRFFKDNWEE